MSARVSESNVYLFANKVHRGRWSLRDIPERIGATVWYRELDDGVLGLSVSLNPPDPQGWYIFIDPCIRGTCMEWPVILHECVHLLSGEDKMAACMWSDRNELAGREKDVNMHAAMLAISAGDAYEMQCGNATIAEMALRRGVPEAFVWLGAAGWAMKPAEVSTSTPLLGRAILEWDAKLREVGRELQLPRVQARLVYDRGWI